MVSSTLSKMCDYNMLDPDDRIPCPYNKTEKILVRKIQYHLIKCPYKYMSEIEFDTCPYNASHVVPKSEMKNHKACCPGRALVERIINKELFNQTARSNMNTLKGCTDVPSYETYVIPCPEDWDHVSSDEPIVDTDRSSVTSNSRYSKTENFQDNSEDPPEDLEVEMKRLRLHERRTEDKVVRQPNVTPAKKSTVYDYSLNMARVVCGQG